MKTLLPTLLGAILTSSCAAPSGRESRTAASIKTGRDSVVLLDVSGISGGRDLWIAADGSAVVSIVAPASRGQSGLQETRYAFTLTAGKWAELTGILDKHRFFQIQSQNRSGVPDEVHPQVFASIGKRTYTVAKWGNDKHPQFDPVYEWLLGIAGIGRNGQRSYKGDYQFDWTPVGFPGRELLHAGPKARQTPE